MREIPEFSPEFFACMCTSYARLLGVPLLAPDLPIAAQMHFAYVNAPFCLLAHDGADDPCFVYANCAAQRCFEYTWSELVGMPSRLSAGPSERSERERLLTAVRTQGFSRDYRGLRVAKSGRRFWIEEAVVWNVSDAAGVRLGQAAAFSRVTSA
jgi:PAS domain S-box-containing protein